MTELNVHQAKTQLSRLLRQAEAGEEVVISRAGRPVAKLVAVQTVGKRKWGMDQGVFKVPDDFDEPLPEDVLRAFEG